MIPNSQPTGLLQKISPELAWRYRIIPNAWAENEASFLVDESVNTQSLCNELAVILGRAIVLHNVPSVDIGQQLQKLYPKENEVRPAAQLSSGEQNDQLDKLIRDAVQLKASDIHIEKFEFVCRVRFRMDGLLVPRYEINEQDFPSLVNKIKIRANMDITEKRLPQDGRINFKTGGRAFDLRVSSLPTLFGEKIVMRILGSEAANIPLQQLGLTQSDFEKFSETIGKTHGIVLISGPTGSGKTTTLYATLKHLNRESKNIITIEDPVEYTLAGVNQVQLKENIGLGFGPALRTFLRQDPDIIMVGEIRDPDTANMAIRASLTGHLVLSTIHTNSSWGTVSRLIDMGIPPYLISGTLLLSVAQRLLRKLCTSCKRSESFDANALPIGLRQRSPASHFVAIGCERCYFTGYSGRIAVYEVLQVDDEVRGAVRSNVQDVGDLLRRKGVRVLGEQAYDLFANGVTTIDEIFPLLIT